MADGTNATSIKPRAARNAREFTFPKGVQNVVAEHQWRVYEALAVARLLAENIEAPARDDDLHTNKFAADAIIRLLSPIEGLHDAAHFEMQAKAAEVADG